MKVFVEMCRRVCVDLIVLTPGKRKKVACDGGARISPFRLCRLILFGNEQAFIYFFLWIPGNYSFLHRHN